MQFFTRNAVKNHYILEEKKGFILFITLRCKYKERTTRKNPLQMEIEKTFNVKKSTVKGQTVIYTKYSIQVSISNNKSNIIKPVTSNG